MLASPILRTSEPPRLTVVDAGEQFLCAGTVVGDEDRYRVDGIVAIGGMSTVYRAADRRTESGCVLKAQYLPAVGVDEAASFKNEARLLASLQFPGIVSVRDVFTQGDYSFVAMDFVDGENLYDRHRRTGRAGEDTQNIPISPAPEDQVVLYAIALARTLDHLHTRAPAIVHRDLKPHNIMRRSTDGALILLDFGIARRLDMLDRNCINDEIGTPGYAAPEQYIEESTIDGRTDIYGLGVLLIELATGYNPRAEDAARFVPKLGTIRHSLSQSLAAILQKCVEAEPDDRYQSGADLLAALEGWKRTPRKLRSGAQPSPAWSLATDGRAAGPLQVCDGVLYAVDADGACYGIDCDVGHVNYEVGPPSEMPAGSRFRLLPPLRGGRSSATIARIATAPGRSRLTISNDILEPKQQLDFPSERLMAAWCADGDLVIAGGESPRISRLSRGRDGQWYSMWRSKLINEPTAMCACGEDAIVVNSQGIVKRVDMLGERVWQTHTPLWQDALPSVCCIRGDCLVLAAANPSSPVVGLNASSGTLLWQTPAAGRWLGEPLLAADGGSIIAATRDAGMIVLSLEDGRTIDRHDVFPRPLVGAAHFMLASQVVVAAEFGSGGRILLYDISRRKVLWSEDLGERGAICGPVVAGDIVAAQEIGGIIRAWRWEDWR